MKTLLLAFALLSTSAFAASIECNRINDIAGLTSQQKQAMVITCEQERLKTLETVKEPAKTVAETVQAVTPEALNKTAEIAKIAGETVKAVAQSLNVTVNEFIATPAGMLVAGLSIWYVAGDGISGMFESIWMILVSIAFLLTVPRTLRYHMKQNQLIEYTQKEVKTIFNGTKIVDVPKYRTFNEHEDSGYVFFEIVAYLVGFVALIMVV